MKQWQPLVVALFGLVACSEAPRGDSTRDSALPETPAVTAESMATERKLTGNRVAGIRFNPSTIRIGTRVGGMVLDSLEVRQAYDSTRVGTARFSGRVELTGAKLRHFDSDVDALCFEADSASAARLPRWEGDERRAWFCLSNRSAAQAAIGPPGDSTPAAIVIDRLTIHRGLSDEVNTARFVRALSR